MIERARNAHERAREERTIHARTMPLGRGTLAVTVFGVPGNGRAAEHSAGQRAAEAALECLGVVAPEVRRDRVGAPCGPPGTLLSIAHSTKYALAAAYGLSAPDTDMDLVVTGVGVDVEGHRRLMPSARHLVSQPEETRAFAAAGGWTDLTKLFAVKEALYKAGCAGGEPFRPRRLPARPGGRDVATWSGTRGRATVAVSAMDGHWVALCVATAGATTPGATTAGTTTVRAACRG